MEQQIKLLIPLFLGGASYEAGEVLELDSEWAKRIVALNQAELVVPDPHQGTAQTSQPPTEKATHDPHHQHTESATAMPPTERAATRTGTPDPKTHPKK